MKYTVDTEYTIIARKIIDLLELNYIDKKRVVCVKSEGSTSRYTIARCHTIPKIMDTGFGIKPHYVIELISNRFYRLDKEEQIKTLIHEILHIPKSFGGGFRRHDYVNKRNVNIMFNRLRRKNARIF